MLGLRAKDPEIRMKFFSLYHESLAKTLFSRLQFIIQMQDWEALSDVFWLKQGLDLLLAILVEDKPITLAPNSARVLPLVVSGSLPDSSGMQPHITDVPEAPYDAPLTFDSLVLKHAQFLNEMSKLQVMFLSFPLSLSPSLYIYLHTYIHMYIHNYGHTDYPNSTLEKGQPQLKRMM